MGDTTRKRVILGEWADAAGLAAGATREYRPEATDQQVLPTSALDNQHVAFADVIEFYTPADEPAYSLSVIADDQNYRDVLNFRIQNEVLSIPPEENTWRRYVVPLGTAPHLINEQILRGQMSPQALLLMTGIPFKNYIVPVVHADPRAGAAAITQPFRIRIRGFVYHVDELPQVVGALSRLGQVQYQDLRHAVSSQGLSFNFPMPAVVNRETWTQLPGGRFQAGPKIWPYWRFAHNAQATQADSPFALTTMPTLGGAAGNVRAPYEELGYPFDTENKALIVRGVGARAGLVDGAATTARQWWLRAGDDEIPKRRIPLGYRRNLHTFGAVRPNVALDGVYNTIPAWDGDKPLIYREQGVFYVRANGSAAIAAEDVVLQVNGVLVELGGQA